MRLHHLGHHQTYTDKLNTALREMRDRGGETKKLAKLGIDTLLSRLDEVPADLRQAIRNNGGGYVNHDLYWRSMNAPTPNNTDGTPAAPRVPASGSKILEAIERDFGSFDAFKTRFTDMANSVFGSGYVFLYIDGTTKTLKLLATANQDNPTTLDQNGHHVSIMTLDLWEHSYYLNFFNKRADFISAWWSLVNWSGIDESYQAFLTYEEIMKEVAQHRAAKQQQQQEVETKKDEL